MAYNYIESMKQDIINYLADNAEILADADLSDVDEVAQVLSDALWDVDEVTGNGSTNGYTFLDADEMAQAVKDNIDLLKYAIKDFCCDAETIIEKFLSDDWVYFDTTIRCYCLGWAIDEAMPAILEQVENIK